MLGNKHRRCTVKKGMVYLIENHSVYQLYIHPAIQKIRYDNKYSKRSLESFIEHVLYASRVLR